MTDTAFLEAPLLVPPPDEQAAIVKFIDYADRRIRRYIRAKQKLIKLLEEQKQAIVHQAVTRGLDPSVSCKPSGVKWLGDLPKHWEVTRLKRLSPRISGRLLYSPAQYFTDAGVPMVFAYNVTTAGIDLAGAKLIPEAINKAFAHHALRRGDVVTVRVGAPGLSAVVDEASDGLQFASLMVIRKSDRFVPEWLCAVMNSALVRDQVEVVQYGAAQKQINISDAVNFLVPYPPPCEQQQIADVATRVAARYAAPIAATRSEIQFLREYRTRLIADVVTGKLDVREAAASLPDETDTDSPDLEEAEDTLDEDTEDPDDEEAAE
jgi:type I restriction enzyme S subunit